MSHSYRIIYRILGILTSLLAYLFLAVMASLFFSAGFNPEILMPLFISICLVIYSSLSRLFFTMVIVQGKPLRLRLRDWIKANAIVSIIAVGFSFLNILVVLISRDLQNQLLTQLRTMAKTMAANNKEYEGAYNNFTNTTIIELGLFFVFIFGIILTHCIWTLF